MERQTHNLQQKTGYLMILVAGMLWGSIGLFVTILKSLGAGSALIAFLRIGTGFILLIPIMYAMKGRELFKIDKKGILMCLALGVFSQGLFNLSYNEAIKNVGVATASVLLYTAPIFVCIMSKLFFKEKIGWIKVAALSLNVIGCTLTVTGGDFTSVHFSVYGAAMGVTAGFLYAMMTILGKTSMKNYDSLTISFYSFFFGCLFLGIVMQPWEGITNLINPYFVAAAIGFGLIPTVGSYFFYMKGLAKGLEASRVSVIASVETVVAAFIGLAVLHEASSMMKLMGIGCVVASICFMNIIKSENIR
ncbi:DMT family transporter [Aminipila terrae]|uniref:EamA family transporter n=1 Tax=Aminipila terrae TaxID=2697030 RepID=A0A6P1MG91_9FIRM|nr:EamA family transporter [Aminipila terrae]QHI71604.1 EamA family transporter [Aminipila terrae]